MELELDELIFLRLFTNDAEKFVGLAMTNKQILSSFTSSGRLSKEKESSQMESLLECLLVAFVLWLLLFSMSKPFDDDE